MSHSTSPLCPRCGAAFPGGATDRPCPACLMSGALAASDADTIELVPGQPVAPGEPAEYPREFGGYRLLGVLGRGGMGTVYEAEQIATARRVALKVLGHEFDSPEMRQRFLREGRLAAGISHPNSLYVFGTEEIEGCPVITMEIAGSGTLNDKLKKRGPLPVAEAVDATLDVISGLEAAYSLGVLHRDIKPSNCFVSPDGSTKIGDFGLSVSTLAKDDSHITRTGLIVGTPAYASPEQLRGRELDVRADIYSVGATLFTLLSGKPPIVGTNAVEIVAAALEEKPKSLAELRDDVPTELAQVVARCLAKKPEQRYADYTALRTALLAFGSTRPEPAPVGRRIFACFIDYAVCAIIPAFLVLSFFGVNVVQEEVWLVERSPSQVLTWMSIVLFGILYFAVLEGIWGAGVGKALMGFRVTRAGGGAPGIGRALLRSSLHRLVGELNRIIYLAAMTAQEYVAGGSAIVGLGHVLLSLSLFATMRRRNGFATLWDLATGTRVVVKPRGAVRPVIDVGAQPDASNDTVDSVDSVGPYSVTEEIVPAEWIVARDPALRRRVWLRRATSELAPARRDVARAGRTRWLQRVETPGATWEVFEAPPGVPFSSLTGGSGLPWESLRHWLYDLATEIASATRDDTLPSSVSLDHVWITAQGRAILLDEPWPKTEGDAELFPLADLADQQYFLNNMASHVNPVTIPLHARPVLQSLAEGSFEKLSFLAGSLRSLLAKPARIDRQLRAASLFAVPLFIVALFALLFVGYFVHGRPFPPFIGIWDAAEAGNVWVIERHASCGTDLNAKEPLHGSTPLIVAARYGRFEAAAALVDAGAELAARNNDGATALHVAALFGHRKMTSMLLQKGAEANAKDNRGWTPLDTVALPWSEEVEGMYHSVAEALEIELDLERIRNARPAIVAILREPTKHIFPSADPRTTAREDRLRGLLMYAFVPMLALWFFQAVTQLITLCLFRATPGQLLFGFAVVDARGVPAGRLRLLGRWLIGWAIPMATLVWMDPPRFGGSYLYLLFLLVPWCIGLVVAVMRPGRGLHDQGARCWLVPR